MSPTPGLGAVHSKVTAIFSTGELCVIASCAQMNIKARYS